MNKDFYSNIEFTDLKKRLNQEILRRGSYKWFDPLTTPSVGEDRTSPLSIPDIGDRILVDDKTYTINNPSEGSLERTRNIHYPAQGENPGGQDPDLDGSVPNTSAGRFDVDELRNMLIGLAKMQDINLFYGRDEVENTAFRDPKGIEDALIAAEKAELNRPLHLSDLSPTKNDPNGGVTYQHDDYPNCNYPVTYPKENGKYVMPSGEFDGEEVDEFEGLGPNNFYDDYGAEPGDGNYHPYNPYVSPAVNRDWHDQDNQRNEVITKNRPGGVPSNRFGPNPRNPQKGSEYRSRPVYGGVVTNCNNACSGLCHVSCDNECSESCMQTCFARCGNGCTSQCGTNCGANCSTQCFSSCKTKCENSTGYACVKAGAQAVKITTTGGTNGEPAKNNIEVKTYSCEGCSYSCQFYPNKKTDCWDAGCMGKCFTSCTNSCSTSCYGGCIDNDPQPGNGYKSGKGRGCEAGCTLNCIGRCEGVCEGYCVQTCWHACKQKCSDNCSWVCSGNCSDNCDDSCVGGSGANTCSTCDSTCMDDCTSNCVGKGCKSQCGIEGSGSCAFNCRMNCSGSSCTSMCEDACSGQCTTCVNTCNMKCGQCTSMCSTGCESACNINCSATCEHSCETNCVHSCDDKCAGCSNLCYSCVGMCVGVCSVKCSNGCSNCTNTCGFWCDSTCNRACFANCSTMCLQTCSGSCSTFLTSETTMTEGPERDPTSPDYIYPHPSNRWEERESFKLNTEVAPPTPDNTDDHDYLIFITFDKERNLDIKCPEELVYDIKQTVLSGGVFTIDEELGEIIIDEDMLASEIEVNKPNLDNGDSLFIITFEYNENIKFTDDDIGSKLPFGFERHHLIHDSNKNSIVIIERDEFLYYKGDNNE